MEMIGRLLARTINVTTWVGMIAILLMMVQITVDVAGKFLFNTPIPATISMVSSYYMVIAAFVPLALVETRNGHITVEVLTEFFPMRTQYHLYSWTYLLSAGVFGALAYRSWGEAGKAQNSGTFMVEHGIKIITWPSYYLLPIGAGLMTVVLVYRWLVYVTGAKSGLGESPTIG
ncbi:TRAP transporter small permease [Sedimentitalea sp.]|uniref:TRAP transporter small permease n=1 Tax=Sedimentitalea sp. TaxID=2048915 RepID=UPI003299AD89